MTAVNGSSLASEDAARILVSTGAVSFRTDPFFRFTSGVESPIYVDNRRLLGFPAERRAIVGQFIFALLASGDAPPAAIAGTATAGIPWAAWIADRLDLPMLYVRSQAKEWGQQRAVEGTAPPGGRVCVIEDLAFTAGSLASAGQQLRAAEYVVDTALTVVTYNTPSAQRRLNEANLRHISLTSIDHAVAAGVDNGLLNEQQSAIVAAWLRDIREEAADHG